VLSHAELGSLAIAHIDCDAFYASVEKRDDPALADLPLIVGGGRRGVVSTCCYIARIRGVRSAMPMFKALKLCPDAIVVKPRMSVYVEVSRQIKSMFLELTPLVEPLSLDEAFLDLTGTARLHGMPPAAALARLVTRIEREVGVSASIGLSHNKFLAKIASDLEKPRGFSVIGRAETEAFLADKPVSLIWGVGPSLRQRLERDGLRLISDLRRADRTRMAARYGAMGDRLWRLSHGEDARRVSARAPVKSISNETTFFEDIADRDQLDGHLWRLAEKVADRAKARQLAGRVVTLKLKQANHQTITRRISLPTPTQLTDRIYRAAAPMLEREIAKAPFRLIGVGVSDLSEETLSDGDGDLLDQNTQQRTEAERAADQIRAKFGGEAIVKGRSLR
jgi:DNA polymerase-4